MALLLGLGKKILIADPLATIVDGVFATPAGELTSVLVWLAVLCYAFQIYFDFSGYSDMAIGLARVFGFSFPENFNQPYRSQSITEFWRRWHMTLSRWFRDYLYIPLGGNREGPLITYRESRHRLCPVRALAWRRPISSWCGGCSTDFG